MILCLCLHLFVPMVKRPLVSTSAESAHLFIEESSEPAQAESVVTSDSNI